MTSAQPETGMPKWLKIVLIVGGVFVVISIGTIAAIFFAAGSVMKDAQDPVKIKQVVASFMSVKDPLPDGFEYKLGLNIFGQKVVGVECPSKDLHLIIGEIKGSNDLSDPEKAINQLTSSAGGASGGAHSKVKFDSEKKGSETVGGRKMSYAVGKTTDEKTDTPHQVFIGIFEPTDAGTVAIFGSTDKKVYDMEDTEAFLKGIEKI